MIKTIGKLTLATILAALVLGVPMGASAQTNATPAPDAPAAPAAKKPKPIPFNGKLGAVDLVNKTITLDQKTKRTLQITSKTRMMKDGKPATLEDAVVGDDVAGRYFTNSADGTLVATSVRFGAKPKPAAAPAATPAPATAPAAAPPAN